MPSHEDFLHSLSLSDEALEPFLPEILADLWELGSIPTYIIELFGKHLAHLPHPHVLDLGCGKGALLIQLARQFPIQGLGIDLMAPFIEEAQEKARTYQVADRVSFDQGDILHKIQEPSLYDIIIYGHDSDLLGNVSESVKAIAPKLVSSGHLFLETYYTLSKEKHPEIPDKKGLYQEIEMSGFILIDEIIWDRQLLHQTNQANNQKIAHQIQTLQARQPALTKLLANYYLQQVEEFRELETEMQCVTYLLKKHNGS
jgi:cyclopropane fatty-acyl-phospholipid synthase-like methyltransferase